MPGSLTSSTYWPSPRIRLGSSRRLTLAPTSLLTGIASLQFRVPGSASRVLQLETRNSRLETASSPSASSSLPPSTPRRRYADIPCSGRDCHREHDESPPPSVADFA